MVNRDWFLAIVSTGIFGVGAALLSIIVNIVIVTALLILLYLIFLSLRRR